MIADKLNCLYLYEKVHPLFAEIVQFLETHDLHALPLGRTMVGENGCFVNIEEIAPKTIEKARLESHRRMIDIQIPLTADETMGYHRTSELRPVPYDEKKDIAFYGENADTILQIRKGMFVAFFPQDAHAPGICQDGLRKAVFKIPF